MDHEEQLSSEEYLRSCIESSVGSICEIDWKHEFHKSQIEVNRLRREVNDLATCCARLLLFMWLRP